MCQIACATVNYVRWSVWCRFEDMMQSYTLLSTSAVSSSLYGLPSQASYRTNSLLTLVVLPAVAVPTLHWTETLCCHCFTWFNCLTYLYHIMDDVNSITTWTWYPGGLFWCLYSRIPCGLWVCKNRACSICGPEGVKSVSNQGVACFVS